MKKILVIFSLFFILGIGAFIVRKSFVADNSSPTPAPALGAKQNSPQSQKVALGDKEYSVSVIKVERPDLLKLIPNFSEKLTASDALEKYGCENLVSAGFYLEGGSPTGLFTVEGKTEKKWVSNKLFNGVLSINDMGTPRITFDPPRDNLRIALQTGPVLMENANYQKLSLTFDKPARRVVAAVSGDNTLYFLVIYNTNQVFDGPNLADMPAVLSEIQKVTGLNLADAVNLDGGAASAFYSPEVSLSELTPVGSFFCTK